MTQEYLESNPIIDYHKQIQSGRVTVSSKVKKVYEHVVNDIINNPESEYKYDNQKASHVVEFVEKFCRHSKGKLGGQKFKLELWQLAMVSAMFGIVSKESGLRKYQEVLLIIGRKNGKSSIASAVSLYMMIADGEPGSECYALASKREQSKIVWNEAKKMVQKSPALKKRIKTRVGDLVSDMNDSSFVPLGRDSNSLDGLNTHMAVFDEVHSWTDQNLYDVVKDSVTAREQPMIFITTTAGTIRESVFDTLYAEAENIINGYQDSNGYKNERMLPIIYELDEKKEWTDQSKWDKANPGLGTVKSFDQLENKVERAKADSSQVKNLVCKEFNIRETTTETWLDFETIQNEETFDLNKLQPKYGIGGVDLSRTTDLTAASVIFMVPDDPRIYVDQMFWLPEDLLEKRSKEDKIPYDLWVEQGWMRVSQGNKVNFKDVTEWFVEVQRDKDIYLTHIGYDSWSAEYFVAEMAEYFGEKAMEPVIQGKKTLSGPMSNLGADLEKKRIIYNNNPILKWNMSNVRVDVDKNDNIQPTKTSNQRRRIDGFASLLNAYTTLENHYDEYITMI